jgi:regulator of protease activity HflC (stomatin/prohibitin superfamily)
MSDPNPPSPGAGQSHPELEPPAGGPVDPQPDSTTQALADALRRSFALLRVVMLFLIGAFLLSNLHTVGPEERGVILRLGRPVGEGERVLLQPGLHLAWPYPFDEFRTVPFSRLLQVSSTVGWYFITPAARAAGQQDENFGPSLRPVQDGYTLTGDANIVHVDATFSYRIADPAQYIFAFENTALLLTNSLNNAIHYASCQSAVDDLLKAGVAGFKDRVRERLINLIESQHLGVTVDNINVTIAVPRQVKPKFDEVLSSSTAAEANKNDARSFADRTLKEAASTASGIIVSARSERENELKRIRDEANRFEELLASYKKTPELLKQRFVSQLIQKTAAGLDYKVLGGGGTDGQHSQLRILLNREEQVPTATPASASPAAGGDAH